MAQSPAEKVLDGIIGNQIDTVRGEAALKIEIDRRMRSMGVRAGEKVLSHAETGLPLSRAVIRDLTPMVDVEKEALKNLLTEDTKASYLVGAKAARSEMVDALPGMIEATLGRGAATFGSRKNATLINKALKGPILGEWRNRMVDEWGADTMRRLRQVVTDGATRGDTLGQIIQDIRGKHTGKFQTIKLKSGKTRRVGVFSGGVISASTRNAQAIGRTVLNSAANAGRFDSLEQSKDLIKGYKWLATLDTRTSQICRGLDGSVWKRKGDTMVAVGGAPKWRGPPPAHWNCRSTLVPVVKSWDELVESVNPEKAARIKRSRKAKAKGLRASMDGQVPATTNYDSWLKKQPKGTQLKVLGPTKWKLWKAGKLTMRDMIDQNHRPLSARALLAKVRAKEVKRRLPKPKPPTPTAPPVVAPPPPEPKSTTPKAEKKKPKKRLPKGPVPKDVFKLEAMDTTDDFIAKGAAVRKALKMDDLFDEAADTKLITALRKHDEFTENLWQRQLKIKKFGFQDKDFKADVAIWKKQKEEIKELYTFRNKEWDKKRDELIVKIKQANKVDLSKRLDTSGIPAKSVDDMYQIKRDEKAFSKTHIKQLDKNTKELDELLGGRQKVRTIQEVGTDITTMEPNLVEHHSWKNAKGVFGSAKKRAHANPERKHINMGSYKGKEFDRAQWHETGHFLEYSHSKYYYTSRDFINRRVDKNKVWRMTDLGHGDTRAWGFVPKEGQPAFMDHYVTKIVQRDVNRIAGSEVLSMGLQQLTDGPSMRHLLLLDKEHFDYTVGVLFDDAIGKVSKRMPKSLAEKQNYYRIPEVQHKDNLPKGSSLK